jgi:heme iron utilization protein
MRNDELPPIPRDPRQPADFDPVTLGRQLLRATRIASLGSLDPQTGHPVVTLASVATDFDGAPVLLVSGLSHHTRNLAQDPRCSLLLSQGGKGDPLAHPRMSVLGRAEVSADAHIRRRYLARHPKAALYVDFPDFVFYRIVPERVQINGGFARAFDGDARYLLAHLPDREQFARLEQAALLALNTEHPEQVARFAMRHCGMLDGPWRATSLDPHGLDLALGDHVARIAFEKPVLTNAALTLCLDRLNAA